MAKTSDRPGAHGVIFDLDGTLIDTLDDITDSMNVVFAACGLSLVSRETARLMVGEGLAILLERASGVTDSKRIDDIVDRYRAVYRERMFERTRLYAGVAEMLDRLAAGGVRMCVLSNKSHEFTVPICRRMLDRWSFVAFEGCRPDGPRKPDATVALELCRQMALAPERCVLVGDSDIDVLTAKNACMKSIGVTWGFRDRHVLERETPDVILDTPAHVAAWILDTST